MEALDFSGNPVNPGSCSRKLEGWLQMISLVDVRLSSRMDGGSSGLRNVSGEDGMRGGDERVCSGGADIEARNPHAAGVGCLCGTFWGADPSYGKYLRCSDRASATSTSRIPRDRRRKRRCSGAYDSRRRR